MAYTCTLAEILLLLLMAVLPACAAAPASVPDGSAVTVYPAPAGARESKAYRLTANARDVFVYETNVHFEPYARDLAVGYAYFDATSPVDVRVTSAKPVDKVEIRPLSLGIKATVIGGNEIRFRLDKPMKVSVDINGKTDGGLIVFAGTPDARPPSPHDPNVRYFGPGIHEINDNEYHVMEVHSGQTIYVVGGAILRARILGDKVDHVRIAGRGIIDGSTLPSRFPEEYRKLVGEKDYKHRPVFIDFRDSHDITVEGVHIIDSPAWTLRFDACHDVAARDLRLIGYVPNSDGIDIVNSQRVVIADCFIRTSDDTIVLKGIQNRNVPRRGNVEDVLVERCTLWADRASALEIGHETEADEIRHVTFRDIDILEQLYGIIGYHAINMHAGDEALVHDILYDNIRVEHCQRLIGTKIEKGIFNRSKGWGRIQNVSFRNIQSLDKADVSLYGHSDENAISGFAFDNITLRGQPVTPELLANGFVRDLKFVSEGKTTTVDRAFPGDLKFEAVALGAAANHAVTKPFTDDPKTVVGPLPPGRSVLNSVPFDFPKDDQRVVVFPTNAAIPIDRACRFLFMLQGSRMSEGAIGTVLWEYQLQYADGTSAKIPVRLHTDVSPWLVWAPGGWIAKINDHKFYIQMIRNPHPAKVLKAIAVNGAAASGTGILLGVTTGK